MKKFALSLLMFVGAFAYAQGENEPTLADLNAEFGQSCYVQEGQVFAQEGGNLERCVELHKMIQSMQAQLEEQQQAPAESAN